MADRYLTPNGLERALTQGRTVEQWLGARTEKGIRVVKWLSIEHDEDDREGTTTIVRVSEVVDDGGPDFIDIYEFTSYDANAEFGVVTKFDTPQEALQYALTNVGADELKFVPRGVIQDEYVDYLKSRR